MIGNAGERRKSGTIYLMELEQPVQFIEPLIPAIFVRMKPKSAPVLAEAMGLADPAEVQRRFSSGRRCYAGLVGGRIATYGWVTFDEESIGELHLCIRMGPGDAYIWNCATLPQYRRSYLYTSLLLYIVSQLRFEGFSRAWIGTDWDNVSSQRGIARAGFLAVADLVQPDPGESNTVWFFGRSNIPEKIIGATRQSLLID